MILFERPLPGNKWSRTVLSLVKKKKKKKEEEAKKNKKRDSLFFLVALK